MSIDWPASTPESRRRAAAALGRLGLSGLGGGLGGYAEDLYANLAFRKFIERGIDGYNYEGNHVGLPLPDGVSKDDFIFFSAMNAYVRKGGSPASCGLYCNLYELADAYTDAGIDGDAGDVADDYKWTIEPQWTVSADAYLPGGNSSYLADNLYGLTQWGYAQGNRAPDPQKGYVGWAPDSKSPAGGWLYHYLGGIWTIFGVRKMFIEIIGRPPTKQELYDFVVSTRPQTVTDVKNKLNSILDQIEKDRQKRDAAIARIQASINNITLSEQRAKQKQDDAKGALETFQAVSEEMKSLSTALNGLGLNLNLWQPSTNLVAVINSGGTTSTPAVSNVDARTAAPDTAVNEIGRLLGVISAELKKANDVLAKANASSGFATAEGLVAPAQMAEANAARSEVLINALRDRVLSESTRVQKELGDLKAKNRAAFLAAKRTRFMTMDESALRDEYAAIKDDVDTEVVGILIEVAAGKGIDVTKAPFPVAAIAVGVVALGAGIWYFKFRK